MSVHICNTLFDMFIIDDADSTNTCHFYKTDTDDVKDSLLYKYLCVKHPIWIARSLDNHLHINSRDMRLLKSIVLEMYIEDRNCSELPKKITTVMTHRICCGVDIKTYNRRAQDFLSILLKACVLCQQVKVKHPKMVSLYPAGLNMKNNTPQAVLVIEPMKVTMYVGYMFAHNAELRFGTLCYSANSETVITTELV